MRLTTRGRYAVTALLDLALQDSQHSEAVSLSDIAKRQDISISYLEQLFSKLRKQGLVVSTRGASGGYHIAKPLDQISIMSIIAAVDESIDARACEGKGNCQEGAMCLTHDLWSGLSVHIEQYLSQVTLEQMIHKNRVIAIAERQNQLLLTEQATTDTSMTETTQKVTSKIDTVDLSQTLGNSKTKNNTTEYPVKKPFLAKTPRAKSTTPLSNFSQTLSPGEILPV